MLISDLARKTQHPKALQGIDADGFLHGDLGTALVLVALLIQLAWILVWHIAWPSSFRFCCLFAKKEKTTCFSTIKGCNRVATGLQQGCTWVATGLQATRQTTTGPALLGEGPCEFWTGASLLDDGPCDFWTGTSLLDEGP
jgi:hypothetical protein